MQVLDQLAGGPAIIAQEIIPVGMHSLADSPGDLSETARNLTEKISRTIVQPLEMLFGDHQRVAAAQRADIQKRKSNFIFVDLRGGYESSYNLAE